MEDWHDYEWRKEQKDMDCRKKVAEWEKLGERWEKIYRKM